MLTLENVADAMPYLESILQTRIKFNLNTDK